MIRDGKKRHVCGKITRILGSSSLVAGPDGKHIRIVVAVYATRQAKSSGAWHIVTWSDKEMDAVFDKTIIVNACKWDARCVSMPRIYPREIEAAVLKRRNAAQARLGRATKAVLNGNNQIESAPAFIDLAMDYQKRGGKLGVCDANDEEDAVRVLWNFYRKQRK